MQTNSKKSPHLTATAGLLAGVIVTTLAFSVTALNFNTVSESSEMAFVTQQFVNPNLNNANPNGNPNANPNAANPNLNPNLLWLWTLRFNFVMRNAPLNNIVNPSCNTVANVGNPGIVPGSIDFVTTTNPNPVPTICGLMNAANQIVAIGNQNQLAGTFGNLNAGNYRVVCLVKEQNQPWVKANFCQSAGLVVQAAIPNPGGGGVNPGGGAGANPVNPNAIDLELQGVVAQLPNGDNEYTLRVFNNPANAGAAAGDFSLRVYPQNLNNIAAPLAVQINPTVFFKINGLAIGQTKEFKLTGTPVVNAGAKIVAELCDYNGDVDSQACSIVNLGAVTPVPVPAQDDEGTW